MVYKGSANANNPICFAPISVSWYDLPKIFTHFSQFEDRELGSRARREEEVYYNLIIIK